jgi:hypothetical protein
MLITKGLKSGDGSIMGIFRFKIKEDRKIETYALASILGGHSSSVFSHGACGGLL